MISIARGVSGGTEPQLADVVHVMKLALKAGKTCLGKLGIWDEVTATDERIDDGGTSPSALKLAETVFEKGAEYSATLGHLQAKMLGPDDLLECKKLDAEYFILRAALASSLLELILRSSIQLTVETRPGKRTTFPSWSSCTARDTSSRMR